MKIVFVVSEAVPYVKTGGLGDVAGSLPKYLKKSGIHISLILPFYKLIKDKKLSIEYIKEIEIEINDKKFNFKIYKDKENFLFDTFLIENDHFFLRDGIYNENNIDYKDNHLRFGLFSLASLKLIKDIIKPDIIHTHDWQTSFLQIYNKIFQYNFKTILTIHNLAYQGIFEKDSLFDLGLPQYLFSIDFLEFYGKVNTLKGGIIFSDLITTVSPTYSKEIQKKEFGFGLDGVLKTRRDFLFGILNGIDYDYWNPKTDKFLYANYNFETIENKKINKLNLYKDLNLSFDINNPLYSMITRITDQKGIDLLINIFDELMRLNLNLIVLGVGDKNLENSLKELNLKYKDKFIFINKFDEPLSHILYAASDFFIMPSKFEPCGLSQMISLRYGTIPIVRSTGGLRDTVIEYNKNIGCGNGFVFYDYEPYEFFDAIKRSLKLFEIKEKFLKVIKIGMNSDFSWESSTEEYIKLYEYLMKK
ncbi:MAG: glycogen synthase GlgA [Caldisericia bacterium]|nr:glycogen synthase GlgA [Caldisericia bacterium]